MKNLQRTMLLYGVLIVLLCVMAMADHEETDVSYAVTGGNIWFDTATGTITDCDDDVTEAIIPDSINGVVVKEIGTKAFQYHYSLKKITLPETITRIHYQAFNGCYNLGSVIIPGNIKHIAEEIFARSSVSRATFLDGILTIPGYTFYDCKNLGSVIIPVSVKEIAAYAFSGCSDLTDVYFGGTHEQWQSISIDYGNDVLNNVTIHYESAGPENPGTTQPPSLTLSIPSFGVSIPLTVKGTGTSNVNFVTAFYNQNLRFIGLESIQQSVYPGLQSIFVPINQWTFVPTLKAFALDDDFKPLSSSAEQNFEINENLPDKYIDILSESDSDKRAELVSTLTEQEAKDFINRFAEWLH